MTNRLIIFSHNSFKQQKSFIVICEILIIFCNLQLKAQSDPGTIQNLEFGIFYTGSTGGTVSMPSVGSRTATGSVILFSSDEGQPAIVRANLQYNKVYTLTASNIVNLTNGSGGTMTLQIDDFDPPVPFLSQTNSYQYWNVGGTLIVGSPLSTPAGNYSGSFDIIFNRN